MFIVALFTITKTWATNMSCSKWMEKINYSTFRQWNVLYYSAFKRNKPSQVIKWHMIKTFSSNKFRLWTLFPTRPQHLDSCLSLHHLMLARIFLSHFSKNPQPSMSDHPNLPSGKSLTKSIDPEIPLYL